MKISDPGFHVDAIRKLLRAAETHLDRGAFSTPELSAVETRNAESCLRSISRYLAGVGLHHLGVAALAPSEVDAERSLLRRLELTLYTAQRLMARRLEVVTRERDALGKALRREQLRTRRYLRRIQHQRLRDDSGDHLKTAISLLQSLVGQDRGNCIAVPDDVVERIRWFLRKVERLAKDKARK